MFPISVTHVRDIKPMKPEMAQVYINYLRNELKDLMVNKIEVDHNRINFRNSMFNGQGRNHLMNPIDKGYFDLDIYSQKLTYSYSTLRMFCIMLVMCSFMEFMMYSSSGFLLGGPFIFLWVYGMNWIISYIRHRMFLSRIVKNIQV